MVTFTDDFSRYVTVYFLKSKSEVPSKFKEFVSFGESRSGKVKVLRSDNGGEYTSQEFSKYCIEKGISHEFTSPYCPEQNGVTERLNRTIMETARSMIYQTRLPLDFWAEACSTAVYLRNRSPTTSLKDITPFESLFGQKPDVSNLRVFGCVCYVHIPDSRRQKLDKKSFRAIFIGYSIGTKGYKLYDLSKKSFVISRDVAFVEKQFHNLDEELDSDGASKREDFVILQDEETGADDGVNDHNTQENSHEDEPAQEPEDPQRGSDQLILENREPVGVEQVPEPKTYEELFLENIRNLGSVRQRRIPSRFGEDVCAVVDSLTSDVNEPKGIEEALNSKHSNEWKEAMISEYTSLMENETWELVPPPEDKNIVGSRWVLKVKRDESGFVDCFKARLVAQGYMQTKGTDYDEVFSPVA